MLLFPNSKNYLEQGVRTNPGVAAGLGSSRLEGSETNFIFIFHFFLDQFMVIMIKVETKSFERTFF